MAAVFSSEQLVASHFLTLQSSE